MKTADTVFLSHYSAFNSSIAA